MRASICVIRMLSMCSVAVLGSILRCRKVCEEHSSIDMRASSQLKEFRIELIKGMLNRCILAIRIVKHIVTVFERKGVHRCRIRMVLDQVRDTSRSKHGVR